MRTLDCVGQRVRDLARNGGLPILRDALGHLSDQNRSPNFLGNERPQRFKGESLVLSARDQNHALVLREQSLFDCVEIGRLGIVDVSHVADFPHEFTTVRPRLVRAKRREHLLERQAARETNGERRHDVFDIVRPAQFCFRHAEDWRVLINN